MSAAIFEFFFSLCINQSVTTTHGTKDEKLTGASDGEGNKASPLEETDKTGPIAKWPLCLFN